LKVWKVKLLKNFSYQFYDKEFEELKNLYRFITNKQQQNLSDIEYNLIKMNQIYLTLKLFTIFENFVDKFINKVAEFIELDETIRTFGDLPRSLFDEVINYQDYSENPKKLIDYFNKKPGKNQITGAISFQHFTYKGPDAEKSLDSSVKTGKYISMLLKSDTDYLRALNLKNYNPNLSQEEQTAFYFLSYYSSIHRHRIVHGNIEDYEIMELPEFEQSVDWFKFIVEHIFTDFEDIYNKENEK